MVILKNTGDTVSWLQKARWKGSSIGFVPTMGALHDGHFSLLQKSREKCDLTVCSIFVNPTQFNNADDFNKYPVTLEKDIYFLEKNKCDILFLPGLEEMYPDGTVPQQHFNLGYLETILEGEYRPGHFQGVCQVVKRLLEIIEPTELFLGQKDYQQCMVIKKLLELENFNARLVICTTQREQNGLAMSSRNLRLDEEQKQRAGALYTSLVTMQQDLRPGDVLSLKYEAEKYLADRSIMIDYVEIARANDLKPVEEWDGTCRLVALVAGFVDDVRLIDNMVMNNNDDSGRNL